MSVVVDKKLERNIFFEDEIDGNAFAIMGAFKRQARAEGWSKEEIDKVREEVMKGDYDHLLQTYMAHCE